MKVLTSLRVHVSRWLEFNHETTGRITASEKIIFYGQVTVLSIDLAPVDKTRQQYLGAITVHCPLDRHVSTIKLALSISSTCTIIKYEKRSLKRNEHKSRESCAQKLQIGIYHYQLPNRCSYHQTNKHHFSINKLRPVGPIEDMIHPNTLIFPHNCTCKQAISEIN